jgi:hypothetical protein
MITPAFSLIITERVPPKLALDFTTATIDSRLTFTRSGNTATVTNSSGVIVGVNADLPRFDFDPVALVCRGLLIEEQRTNFLLYSQDFSTRWAKLTSADTLTANTTETISPANTNTAGLFVPSTTNGAHVIRNQYTFDVGTYTLSVYVKYKGQRYFHLALGGATMGLPSYLYRRGIFDFGTDGSTCTVYAAPTSGAANVIEAGNGYFRVSITFTTININDAFNANLDIACANPSDPTSTTYAGNGTSGLYVWGAQNELGAFATSYIPTTTTGLTRNADVASIIGTNFSGFWQTTRGSVMVRALPSTVSGTRPVVQFDDNTADNIIALRGNTTNPELYVRSGAVDQAAIDAGTIAANTAYRLAGAWATNDCAASVNSGTPVLDTSATIPTVTQARLGSDGTNYLNGHLQSLEYYAERVLNSNLQVTTSVAGSASIVQPIINNVL